MTPFETEAGRDRSRAASAAKAVFSRIPRGRAGKWLCTGVAVGALPFCIWLVGTVVTWVAPPSFQSSALVRVESGAGSASEVAAGMRSEKVMKEAARLLVAGSAEKETSPMSAYLLSTSLSVEPKAGPDLIRLEARGNDAADASRMVLAVVDAYALVHGTGGLDSRVGYVYLEPAATTPARVSDETRMVLGLGGLAGLGLLLAIPLLEGVERVMPLRRAIDESEGLKV